MLLLTLALFTTFACKDNNGGDADGDRGTASDSDAPSDNAGTNGGVEDESTGSNETAFIFSEGDEVFLICEELSTKAVNALSEALSAQGITLKRADIASDIHEHEIVIGKTERSISDKAYTRLARSDESDSASECPFIIYSDGSSLAIAYSGDALCASAAVEKLIDGYIDGGVSIRKERGTVHRGFVDVIEEYKKADEELISAAWKKLATESDDALSMAMIDFYTLYSDKLISWFANMYDPAVGGYYYSNSARDNTGYLPDADSTYQALNFISSSGMAYTGGDEYVSGSYADVLSEEMKAQIVYFIKGLQVSDGYFYHPQWGKKLTDQHPSRRERDLTRSVSVLRTLGAAPTYDTPSGVEGDGVMYDGSALPVSAKVGRLGRSVQAMAARAVKSNTVAVPSYLRNKESFVAHLNSLNIVNDSYSIGHDLVSAMNTIKHRDEVLKAAGADYSLVDILIEWLNSKQLENGLWSKTVDYAATNGLMKISGIYSSAGVAIPRAKEAATAAMNAMTSTEEPDVVTDVYNTWAGMNRILASLSSDKETAVLHDELLAELRENAAVYIKATKEKLRLFAKDDGSFSYTQTFSSSTSQGVPAAVPGSREGDMNATTLCSSDLVGVIYSALNYSAVPIFSRADMKKYTLLLEELGAVVKDEDSLRDITPVTFDEEKLGAAPSEVTASAGSAAMGGSVTVEADGRGEGNVLRVVSMAGGKEEIVLQTYKISNKETCFVFESDICVDSMTSSYSVQIFLDECYMITLRKKNGRVSIVEASSNSASSSIDQTLSVAPEFGEWFNLRAEYYPGSAGEVRIKLYVNGALAAVTDNYYDKAGDKLTGKSTPRSDYTYLKIQTLSSAECEFSVDNLNAYRCALTYEAVTDPTKTPAINVDCPSEPITVPTRTEYDFNDGSTLGIAHNFYGSVGETEGGYEIKEGRLVLGSTAGRDGFALENRIARPDYTVGTTYYFETDFTYLGGTPTNPSDLDAAFVGLLSNGDDYKNGNMLAYGYLSFADTDGNAVRLFGYRLEKNVTYRIRLEYEVGDGEYDTSKWEERFSYVYANMRMYVNGTEVALPQSSAKINIGLAENGSDTHFYGFGIYTRGEKFSSLEIALDNAVIGSTPPSDNPDEPDAPDVPDAPSGPITVPTNTEYSFDGASSGIHHSFYGSGVEGEYEIRDGSLVLSSTAGRDGFAIENKAGSTEYVKGTTYYFETDFTYTGGTPTNPSDLDAAFVGLLSSSNEFKNGNMFAYGYLSFTDASGSAVTLFGYRMEKGTTYRIRIEYEVGEGNYNSSKWDERFDYVYANMRMYVNGVEIALPDSSAKINIGLAESGSDLYFFGFGIYTRGEKFSSLEITLDNVSIGSTPPTEEPDNPEPDAPTPDTPNPDEPDPDAPVTSPDEDMSNTSSDEFPEDMKLGDATGAIPDGGWV